MFLNCRKRDILRSMLTNNIKDPIYISKFGDNTKVRTYIKKEVYWNAIYVEAKQYVSSILLEDPDIPDSFTIFFEEERHLHILNAFAEIWKDIKASAETSKQLEIVYSSKRVVYRLV